MFQVGFQGIYGLPKSHVFGSVFSAFEVPETKALMTPTTFVFKQRFTPVMQSFLCSSKILLFQLSVTHFSPEAIIRRQNCAIEPRLSIYGSN